MMVWPDTVAEYTVRITLGLPKPAGMTPEETATWSKLEAEIADAKAKGQIAWSRASSPPS